MMLKGILLTVFLSHLVCQNSATAMSHALPPLDTHKTFNLGPECRFKIKISNIFRSTARYDDKEPFGSAGLIVKGLRFPQEYWGINFRCARSDEEFANDATAIFQEDRWQLNDTEDNRQLIKYNALHFYEINATGAKGWAITYDDSFGEEKFRQRTLAYCVVRTRKSICGASKVGYLESIARNRKADFTHYVHTLLETIEFLDDVLPDNASKPKGAVE